MTRITDALVICNRCGAEAPCGEMTMNEAERWECDDTAACTARSLDAVEAPTPEQVRAYLDANPEFLRAFLHKEARRDPRWLADFINREHRRAGGNTFRVLR